MIHLIAWPDEYSHVLAESAGHAMHVAAPVFEYFPAMQTVQTVWLPVD